MTPAAAYLEAALPEPVAILQQRLSAFCIGHRIHLLRHGNALATGGIPTLDDLYMAVFFCSQSYEEGAANLDDPKLDEKFAAWANLVGTVKNEFELYGLFYRYMAAGMRGPVWRERKREGYQRGGGGTPLLLAMQNTLTGYLGFTRTEALNNPYGDSLWRYCAYWESQGRLRIVGDGNDPSDPMTTLREAARQMGMEPMRFSKEEQAAFALSPLDRKRAAKAAKAEEAK